jgi:hypothetical protein
MSQITRVTWTAWEHDGTNWTQQPTVKYEYTNADGKRSGQTFKPKTLAEFQRLLQDAREEVGGSRDLDSLIDYLKAIGNNSTNALTWEEFKGDTKPTQSSTTTSNQQNMLTYVQNYTGKWIEMKDGVPTGKVFDTKPKTTTTTQPKTTTTTQPKTTTTNTSQSSYIANASQQARNLIKKALLETDMQNLANYSWWSTSPYKNEAWSVIQNSFANAVGLASLVSALGITDLQKRSWWANSPYKDAAWAIINSDQSRSLPASPTSPTSPTSPVAPTTPTSPTANVNDPRRKSALDYINSSNLDENFKAILREIVNQWDFDGDNILNIEKVLTDFNRMKRDTIDPEFNSRANAFEQELIASKNFMMAQRESELEKERLSAGENIRQAKSGLEQAGLTFTGQAIQDLGAQSAYSQGQTPQQTLGANPDGSITITRPDGSVITIPASELGFDRALFPIPEGQPVVQPQNTVVPTQPTFGGMFYEGKVNQLNRLMSQGSEVGYRSNIDTLGRQAEQMLGSGRTAMLGIPGFNVSGNVTGTVETQRQQALGDLLKSLAAQQNRNYSNKQPVFTTDILNQF